MTATLRFYHEQLYVVDITLSILLFVSTMVKCDLRSGKFMACCLMYRDDVLQNDVNDAMVTIITKHAIQFVGWSTAGYNALS